MASYKNIMENIVEEIYEKSKGSLDCCQCEKCRCDIIAYALNHLPPRYAVSEKGSLYAKMFTMNEQNLMDVTAALAAGAAMVKKHPRHEK